MLGGGDGSDETDKALFRDSFPISLSCLCATLLIAVVLSVMVIVTFPMQNASVYRTSISRKRPKCHQPDSF